MDEWQYMLSRSREAAERGESGLVRLPVNGPVALAEYVSPRGTWEPEDRLWRVKYQGADYDLLDISAAEAERYLRLWVEIGRLDRYPDPASSFTESERAAAVASDEQAKAIWRGVEAPPGVESISVFDE